jgi:hypothetical protein
MDQKEHANKENTLYDEVQKETTKARPPVVLSLSLFFFCRRVLLERRERNRDCFSGNGYISRVMSLCIFSPPFLKP